MKTCDVRQCIKNLNGFSFSASILCNVIKMRQLIWSFWLNIQFKTYRRVLRGWPMVFWDKFKHSQPRCRRTLLFLLYMSPKPSLYTWKDHCIAFMTFRSVSVTTSGWTKPKFAIICRHSSIVFSEKNGKHQSRKYKDAVSGWERNAPDPCLSQIELYPSASKPHVAWDARRPWDGLGLPQWQEHSRSYAPVSS